ncbi:uncharacterized protein EI90DRAFT_3095542 [Cantharellus anzutake]|uniref:uncharacterized protein n=1 Tax=Cantharellus anzutake TaxID=1750568 RepID=UPI0019081F24|nr:uncharacterized protein EI90DRAFT_3095542 [Cantharellus anzutake]KAF8311784.1 hypothetical protein EI90DRAFT_3095542 [Cantharellus anzutake]
MDDRKKPNPVLYDTRSGTPHQHHHENSIRGQSEPDQQDPWDTTVKKTCATKTRFDNRYTSPLPSLTTSSSHLVVESIQTGRPTTPDSDSPADQWEVDTPPLAEHHHLTPTPQTQLGIEDNDMRYANESPEAEKGDQTHRTVYNMFEAMHDLTDRFNGIRFAGLWENFLDEYTLWYSNLPRPATLDTFPTPSHDSELEERLKTVKSNISCLTEANAYLTDRLLTTETPTTAALPCNCNTCDPNMMAAPMANLPLTKTNRVKTSWASVVASPPPAVPTHIARPGPQMTTMDMQAPTTNPHILIIRVNPLIPPDQQPNGLATRKKINNMLGTKNLPHYLRVMAVGYSLAGNIKITMAPTCCATDLEKYGKEIAATITDNEVLSALPDMEHFRHDPRRDDDLHPPILGAKTVGPAQMARVG